MIKHAFVFIEVFGAEGGIQSYIQDVLDSYRQAARDNDWQADVFLLRDAASDHASYQSASQSDGKQSGNGTVRYHYLKHGQPLL